MTTVTMAGMTATGAEREEVRQAANQGASMIHTEPGWVRISDITPEIGDQMDRAAWTGACLHGYQDEHRREAIERVTRLDRFDAVVQH